MADMMQQLILDELKAIRSGQETQGRITNEMGLKLERVNVMTIETGHSLTDFRREFIRHFENCPHGLILKDHLEDHSRRESEKSKRAEKKERLSLTRFQKVGIIASIVGGSLVINYLIPALQGIITTVFFNGGANP